MSLADLPELVGFFSYSREDDEDSKGALSALRERIQRELRSQLGRSRKDFRLWQDAAAIAHGRLWQDEIRRAVAESVFFIPIVTPTAVRSGYCKLEFNSFLSREAELSRSDLVFPILYIPVAALEDEQRWRADEVLNVIGTRQYMDWQKLRHLPGDSTEVGIAVERFCGNIVRALNAPWTPPAPTEADRRARDPARRPDQAAMEEPGAAAAGAREQSAVGRETYREAAIRGDARRREAQEMVGPGARPAPTWSDRIAGILLIMLGCGVLSWFVAYDFAGISWGAAQTIAIIAGTIASGIASLMGGRRAILASALTGVPASILAISAWTGRVGELFDLSAFSVQTSLTTAWLLIVCYVPALAFLVWRAWQLPKPRSEPTA
jgi:hypothetical protein